MRGLQDPKLATCTSILHSIATGAVASKKADAGRRDSNQQDWLASRTSHELSNAVAEAAQGM